MCAKSQAFVPSHWYFTILNPKKCPFWVLPRECSRPKVSIIRSGIDRWSDCIGQDRDSHHLGALSTILQHFTHTMKPSDPLLLADVTLSCEMYPAGKVDISQHLAILGFSQNDPTSSHPQTSASHLLGLQGPLQIPAPLPF